MRFFTPAMVSLLLCGPAVAQDGGVDAGLIDAGVTDAGASDAGSTDAGDGFDAGENDAGTEFDAGNVDAGNVDAGNVDAGNADAGVDCIASCSGNTLQFCDNGETYEIDCTTEGAQCGVLDDTWGEDCLLPLDAACSPGYAEGRSRCDRSANLTCVVDVCAPCPDSDCSPVYPDAPPAPSSSGDVPTIPGDDPNALSCLGCTDTPSLPFIALLFAFGLRRRRRRQQ